MVISDLLPAKLKRKGIRSRKDKITVTVFFGKELELQPDYLRKSLFGISICPESENLKVVPVIYINIDY